MCRAAALGEVERRVDFVGAIDGEQGVWAELAAAESVGDVINRAADAFRDAFKTAASAVTMGDDVPPPPPASPPPPPPAPEPPVRV